MTEAVRSTGNMARDLTLMKVWAWDIGPEKPTPPKRPQPPKGVKEGDVEYDIFKIEFAEQLAQYEVDLKAHKVLKDEYSKWLRDIGGAMEHEFWSIDYKHAEANDLAAVKDGRQTRRRWYLSSRTRGHSKLKNFGLPEGMKPGHGQAEAERRQRELDEEFAAARAADPIYSSESWHNDGPDMGAI